MGGLTKFGVVSMFFLSPELISTNMIEPTQYTGFLCVLSTKVLFS